MGVNYEDDEPILKQSNATDEPADLKLNGYTEGRVFNKVEVPLEESKLKVLLELKGVLYQGRLPVDLVTVLDISGSMKGARIAKLKLAMQFVLQKLSHTDRLSVVTFNRDAKRLCPLRQITETSRTEIADMVNALKAEGATNTQGGLETALKILDQRSRTRAKGRHTAIMLMSDGYENNGSDAAKVRVDEVPVYTFGIGDNYDSELLSVIADNSDGGMFAPVTRESDLTVAFSMSLAGLLNVAIQDLTLTCTPEKGAKITRVNAGNYQQTKGSEVDPVTVTFGSLYDEETRKVLVTLTLPKVDRRLGADYLKMEYKYRVGEELKSEERSANVTRIATANEAEIEEVVAEEKRLRTASSIKEARILADAKKLEEAKIKLVDAKTSLSEVDALLNAQLDQLLLFMASQETYDKQGRAFALALEASHDKQRGGTVSKLDMFNTRLMNLYKEQAELFDKDPAKPVGPDPPKPIQPNPNEYPKSILLRMIDMVVAFMKIIAGKIKGSIV